MRKLCQHIISQLPGCWLHLVCVLGLIVSTWPNVILAQYENWFAPIVEDPYDMGYVSSEDHIYSMAFGDLDGDGDEDLVVTKNPIQGWPIINSYYYHENIGTPSQPSFAQADSSNIFGIPDSGLADVYAFVDIDADGDLDLFGRALNDDEIFYVENSGTPSRADFSEAKPIMNPFGLPTDNWFVSDLTFGDLDNDGDLDVLINGSLNNTPINQLMYRENIGTPQEPHFQSYQTIDIEIWEPMWPPYFAHSKLYDWDCDGDIDILCYTFDVLWAGSELTFLENTGSVQAARFELDANHDIKNVFDLRTINFNNQPWRWLRYADIDDDGDPDAFTEEGFLRNINDCVPAAVDEVEEVQNLLIYPNPARDRIYISQNGDMNNPNRTISIYYTQGREVYRDKVDITGDKATEVELYGLAPGLYTIVVTDSEVLYAGRVVIIPE